MKFGRDAERLCQLLCLTLLVGYLATACTGLMYMSFQLSIPRYLRDIITAIQPPRLLMFIFVHPPSQSCFKITNRSFQLWYKYLNPLRALRHADC